MQLQVSVCYFKRTVSSEQEKGIMIDDDKLIIDANGKPVEAPVWNYRCIRELGHVIFHL